MKIVILGGALLLFSHSFALGQEKTTTREELATQIENVTQAIAADKGSTELYVERAKLVYQLNAAYRKQQVSAFKLRDVIKDIDRAIEIDGTNPELYATRAEYHKVISMNLDKAIEDITKAIELQPMNARWYLQRTNYEDLVDACDDWEKCKELGEALCDRLIQEHCNKPAAN